MKATHEADSTVGLLLVSNGGARLDEWRRGATAEVARFELGEPMADSHELRGPAASHPRGGGEGFSSYRSSQQRDLFERRLEQHRIAFVRDVAAKCLAVARERGWSLVLVLGDPHLTRPAAEVLRHGGIEVERSDRNLGWLTHHELAKAVGPELEHEGGRIEIRAGEAVHARAGEWGRYSTPAPGGAEYVAVCLPAFSPDTVHRAG